MNVHLAAALALKAHRTAKAAMAATFLKQDGREPWDLMKPR